MSLKNNFLLKSFQSFYKQIILLLVAIIIMFTSIGMLTTMNPSSKLSNDLFVSWTSNWEQSIFYILLSMESNAFSVTQNASEQITRNPADYLLNMFKSIRLQNTKSFLSNELPGFSTYENTIIVAGEGLSKDSPFSDESGPPIDDILLDRVGIDVVDSDPPGENQPLNPVDIERKTVFLYSSHNRESFLPHLPDEANADLAYHKSINITKVSERIADSLENNGIGTRVDTSDITSILHEKGWKYGKSYAASRPIVEEAISNNRDLLYMIDVHRDSLPRDKTTKEIDGISYSKFLFVIGAEYKDYEKNLKLATKLHYMIEEKYPGLSKGVITKQGPGSNGVYNQDLMENAFLVELGGYENTLDEMYRSADILADVFSEMYFEAEKVNR